MDGACSAATFGTFAGARLLQLACAGALPGQGPLAMALTSCCAVGRAACAPLPARDARNDVGLLSDVASCCCSEEVLIAPALAPRGTPVRGTRGLRLAMRGVPCTSAVASAASARARARGKRCTSPAATAVLSAAARWASCSATKCVTRLLRWQLLSRFTWRCSASRSLCACCSQCAVARCRAARSCPSCSAGMPAFA